jgi:hypothetical protein
MNVGFRGGKMEKAQEILFHIDELYTENPSEEKIIRQSQENPVRYQAWVDAFKDYDLSDVLQAIDEYWEYKNSKTKPNVAQIKAKLNAKNTEKMAKTTVAEEAKADFAWQRMDEDIEKGKCNWNMPTYRMAERIVLEEWLSKEMPADLWQRMDYYGRVKQAKEKGLFDRFDDALIEASRRKFGRDYQFESENDIKSAKNERAHRTLCGDSHGVKTPQNDKDGMNNMAATLAAHWKMELN